MCDRHNKEFDNVCLEHEVRICDDCATNEHSQTPCESVPVANAAHTIHKRTETLVEDFKRMKFVSQSILDGKQHEYSLRTITEAEEKFKKYVESMKQKFVDARKAVRPAAELSREELWKLKTVATKRLPNPVSSTNGDDDGRYVDDLLGRLVEMKKQTKVAKDVMDSLPNFIEVTVDEDFMELIKFTGNPVHVIKNGETEGQTNVTEENNDTISAVTTDQTTLYLIEKSKFSLENCVDILLMEEYLIAAVGDSIQKRELKHMSFRQGISVPGADKICLLGEATTDIAVLQTIGFISVIQTAPNLVMLYRLISGHRYLDMSYMECVPGVRGIPAQSPVFVVCYNINDGISTDYVDLIQARQTKYPGKPPKFHIKAKTLADSFDSKNRSRFRGTTRVSALHGKYALIAALKGVSCLSKAGTLMWTIDLFQQITNLLTHKSLIYACIENEKQIMTIGKQGHVIQNNILPVSVDFIPERINALKDTLLVKAMGKSMWTFYRQMTDS